MATDRYPPGSFCWADVATTDATAAKVFYTDLFGWSAEDFEMAGAPPYTMFRQDSGDVCGLDPMPPEMQEAGVPPHWSVYVAVDTVDATAAQAAELGGAVVVPPFDIPETGRMAVIRDPEGAALSLWQRSGAYPGYAKAGGAPGTVCWNELMTPDTEAAARFYGALFEWRVRDVSGPDGAYHEFLAADGSVGGMLPITAEMGDVAPNWLVYFAVADCDATAARIQTLGGGIVRPATTIPDVGRFAVVHDPLGAVFAIIALGAGGA